MSCGTVVCCIVQVEVRVEVTEVMDELQRLLGGSSIGLKYGWHEDEAVGVALAKLLLRVLQVAAQPLVLVDACLASPRRFGVPMVNCRRHTGNG